jgi:hypothetical protein
MYVIAVIERKTYHLLGFWTEGVAYTKNIGLATEVSLASKFCKDKHTSSYKYVKTLNSIDKLNLYQVWIVET